MSSGPKVYSTRSAGHNEGMPAPIVNRQFRLAARPVGLPKATDWNYTEESVRDPADGEVLVKVLYISLDPAMRGWMNDGKSYIRPVAIGEVMRAGAGGQRDRVEEPGVRGRRHRHRRASACRSTRCPTARASIKVDTRVAPLPIYLGTLGMPGMTAYFGLLDIGKPQPGRDGGRLGRGGRRRLGRRPDREDQGLPRGRHRGRRGQVRATSSSELGFDAAIDYKHEDVKAGAQAALPQRHRRLLRQRGRRHPRRGARAPRAARAHRHLRRHLAVQQHAAASRARRTTCRCWSTARA